MLLDVRATAPDLYFAALLAPPTARPALTALFALEAELLRIPARVSQPTLGLLRVAWWRDQLAAGASNQPLLAEVHKHFARDAAVLADFADSFGTLFEELPAEAAQKIIAARAMLWATLVARVLACPVPQAHAAAAAHYGLVAAGRAGGIAPDMPKCLKVIIRLAIRRDTKRNNWLGYVWTALRSALY